MISSSSGRGLKLMCTVREGSELLSHLPSSVDESFCASERHLMGALSNPRQDAYWPCPALPTYGATTAVSSGHLAHDGSYPPPVQLPPPARQMHSSGALSPARTGLAANSTSIAGGSSMDLADSTATDPLAMSPVVSKRQAMGVTGPSPPRPESFLDLSACELNNLLLDLDDESAFASWQ